MANRGSGTGRALADLVLDRRCVGCDGHSTVLCECCWFRLLNGGPQRLDVPELLRWQERPTAVVSAGGYSDELRRIVLAHKERGTRALARPLGILLARGIAMLADSVNASSQTMLIIPVPAHKASLRRRGEDTVNALATEAARALGKTGQPADVFRALTRAPGSQQQARATAAQRRTRQQGSMSMRTMTWPEAGSMVILVDDVLTTGATCAEALRVLTSGAPRRATIIGVATVAHAQPGAQLGYVGAAPEIRRCHDPRSS